MKQNKSKNPFKNNESESSKLKRQKAAESTGYEYLGRVVESDTIDEDIMCNYGIYRRMTCGHTRILLHVNIARGISDCKECIYDGYKTLCKELEMQFNGFTRPDRSGTLHVDVILKCGHPKQIQTGNLTVGAYLCKTCWFNIFKKDCAKFDIDLIEQVAARIYKVKLPCGCTVNKDIQGLRYGRWTCKSHKKSNLDAKSNLYLFKITRNKESWLKIGISANPEVRSTQLSNYEDCIINILQIVTFYSGHDALRVEKSLHKKYLKQRLPKEVTKEFMHSGFTECYPLSMLDILLQEMHVIKEING